MGDRELVAAAVMNSFGRTLAATLVAAGLFGYIYFVESKRDPATWKTDETSGKRERVFASLDKAKVTSLTLKRPGGEMVHAEKNGEDWALVSPFETPADPTEIGTILDALQNLETEDVVSETATNLADFGLSEPRVSVSVVATGAPQPFEIELGDAVPAAWGLFARVPGKPRVFTVATTLENTLSKSAFDLRDRSLVRVKRDEILSLDAVEKGRTTFRLVRGSEGGDDWKIEKPIVTRAARWTVDSFLGLIENLKMDSIVTESATPQDLARFGLGTSARRVGLGLVEGRTVTLEIGRKTDDGKIHARDAASTLVATIPIALVDDLDKGLRHFRAVRLLDVAAYEVAGFEVTAGGTSRSFTKSTTKGKDGADEVVWRGTAPTKDATQEKTSEALFAIGGLDASEFIDAPKALASYGLDAPALRVVLRFDGGKKDDWFEVAVRGDSGYAKRRDDTAILKLDKAKTEALIASFVTLSS